MNVSRRRYMGEKGGSSPYQRIEYLESTGTQYIDTGIKASHLVSIKISLVDFFNQDYFGQWPFGGRNSNSTSAFGLFINGNTGMVTTAIKTDYTPQVLYSSVSSSSVVEIGSGVIKIGSYQNTYTLSDFSPSQNVILFGLQNGVTALTMKAKIGNTYITNGTITRDFIPVRVGSVGYMYDTVSGELFGNAGTGDFVLGPDIN